MVSFGFSGTPNTISLQEYQSLSKLGFNSLGDISEVFHNDRYVFLPGDFGCYLPGNEKKVTNICKFLKVDSVIETGQNSILNINLKADIVIICDNTVVYFQAKSSLEGARNYLKKYSGRQIKPFFNKKDRYRTNEELRGQIRGIPDVKESYPAPGVVYLDTKSGDSTLPMFLKEFSEWIGLPVREDYQKLLGVIQKCPKPLSIRVLQKVFHDNNVMKSVTHLSSIHPISIVQGDCVYYAKQKEKLPNYR